ncbi:helix-turn-helix domain-containing protein, partial [Methylobacterium oxalidis]|uniref:helix-turn-helix domain-containing protein n=1 Tax=Methylobacterium oxalidis TaxID=944322 RepID=UPI0033473CBE
RKRSFSTGRLLCRPHQHHADAPVDGFVTALHKRVKLLILNGQMSLVEIAMTDGFCDQAHMALTFRKVANVSPSQYLQSLH